MMMTKVKQLPEMISPKKTEVSYMSRDLRVVLILMRRSENVQSLGLGKIQHLRCELEG